MNRHIFILLVFYFSLPLNILSQNIQEVTTIDFAFLEDYLNENEDQADIPLEDISNILQGLLINPLDLNSCTEEDLADLFILDQIQIQEIINHRTNYGEYLVIEELQTIQSMDISTISKIRPFITINHELKVEKFNIKWLSQGETQLIMRTSKILEQAEGFKRVNNNQSIFLGPAYKIYTQFRHQYLQMFRYGITIEKDAAEPWFSNNKSTVFTSIHLALRDHGRWKDVVIGDYSLQFGQGVIMNTRFAPGKSSLVMNVKRGGRAINAYNGLNELIYFRGAAGTFQINSRWSSSLFFSYKPLHATINTNISGQEEEVSSFYENGSFRTLSDLKRFKTLNHSLAGYKVAYSHKRLKLNQQSFYNYFDKPIGGVNNLYEIKRFQGNRLFLTSLDYQYNFKRFLFFGESAWSQFKKSAHVIGTMASLSRKIDFSLVYRHLPADFQVLHSQVFSESGINEYGLYWGLTMRPHLGWKLDTYVDFFKFPWLKFRISQPSTGREHLVRVTHYKKKKYEWYFQYKWEQKYQDLSTDFNQFITLPIYRHNWRLHGQWNFNKPFEFRSRVEVSGHKILRKEHGWLMYQEAVFSPLGSPVNASARVAYFHTPSFNSRIYTYERDLIYNYALPFFYGEGLRSYLNLRYRFSQLSLEGRISHTYFFDRDTIGVGPDLINSNHRTEIKFQIKWNL